MCTVICLCFFYDTPCVGFISLFLFRSLLLSFWTPLRQAHSSLPSCCPYLFPFLVFDSILLSPPVPLLKTPQPFFSLLYPLKLMEHITSLLKIALLQSQFIFFFFLSFCLSPFLMLLFFFFSVPPSGGKWVTEKRLVSSFISWQRAGLCAIRAERLRLWDRGPETGLMAVCLSWFLLYGHRA